MKTHCRTIHVGTPGLWLQPLLKTRLSSVEHWARTEIHPSTSLSTHSRVLTILMPHPSRCSKRARAFDCVSSYLKATSQGWVFFFIFKQTATLIISQDWCMKMFYKLRNFTLLAIYAPQASWICFFLTVPETGLVSTMWPLCSMIFTNTEGKLKIGLDQSKWCLSTAF